MKNGILPRSPGSALISCILAALPLWRAAPAGEPGPLRMVVMDPLAAPLACACVAGYAQRRYGQLAKFMEARLGRPVELAYSESLGRVLKGGQRVHLIIGKRSVAAYDAARAKLPVRPIAMLTDKQGLTTLDGMFVVRGDSQAKSLADLKDKRIVFGPQESAEKYAAAFAALEMAGVPPPKEVATSPGCNVAAVEVIEKRADAAVISSYAMPLLVGCSTIDKGELRVIARTLPLPFVAAFVTDAVGDKGEAAIKSALLAMRSKPELLEAMESKLGFVAIEPGSEWTQWLGPQRNGHSLDVPAKLPAKPRLIWKRPLTGLGLSGIAATQQFLIVADKTDDQKDDVWRCLDTQTGAQVWALQYPAPGNMNYSNSPRATPLIHNGLVYLLGAYGHLHCVKLATGEVVWKRNVFTDFGSRPLQWGMCVSPLLADGKLIVSPGAKDAAIAALDPATGKVIWKTPGRAGAYASFIVGTFGNVRQVVGYDVSSLGGWDLATGKRLWEVVPQYDGDFNVATPVNVNGKLLVSTENNGTRLYAFGPDGRIKPKPIASNEDLMPDTATPVVHNGFAFGVSGALFCLDLSKGLKTAWEGVDGRAFDDYASLIAGNGRLLAVTVPGQLLVIAADRSKFQVLSKLQLFEETEVWSYPALMGDRLYIRNHAAVYCIDLHTE